MDDAFDMKLRQRFAQAECIGAEESFVTQHRLRRARLARRNALLRAVFVGVLLLLATLAVRLLLPWLGRVLHEADVLATRLLQGRFSLESLVLVLAMVGASIIGVWAWRQVLPRD